MADDSGNPLLSNKSSDSNITISLHPLVLLTVSDQITRHRARGQEGHIVGALLGQQRGREITAEHAFPCKVIEDAVGNWVLDQEWMERRLQQYKDVHKAPALDFVGWFTLCPETGPTQAIVPIQKQVIAIYNESAILLALHPAAIAHADPSSINGKLPLTIYESVMEMDTAKEEGSMQVDGEDGSLLKFRPLPYSIETDETEMIAIDYVAKGAGSAAAVTEEAPPSPATKERAEKKGKKRADLPREQKQEEGTKDSKTRLTAEEEDQIAGIATRLNSVRMLQSRLSLLSKFLQSQPPSYLWDWTPIGQESPTPAQLPHLRNILALLTRLSLLTSTDYSDLVTGSTAVPDSMTLASQSQANDVALSSLLSLVSQETQALSELGRKFSMVEQSKIMRNKGKTGYSQYGSMEEHDTRVGGFGLSGGLLV